MVYLSVAYLPLVGPGIVFGIGGIIMLALIILTTLPSSGDRSADGPTAMQRELRLVGYFTLRDGRSHTLRVLGYQDLRAGTPRR